MKTHTKGMEDDHLRGRRLIDKSREMWSIINDETCGDACAIIAVLAHHVGLSSGLTPEVNKQIFSDALDDVLELNVV